MIENNIPQFAEIYDGYKNAVREIGIRIYDLGNQNMYNINEYKDEVLNFDVKLRLGMAIRNLELNEGFVQRKFGALKECHMMFYKLSDIWFAYETFFKIHNLTFNRNRDLNRIDWLDNINQINYSNNLHIISAYDRCNNEIQDTFNTNQTRLVLNDYLEYCIQSSKGRQIALLNSIIPIIEPENNLQAFTHTQLLSLTYAIRCNFVHNGEVTIIPNTFSYELKNDLLKSLYKYLVVVILCASTITIEQKLINSPIINN